MRQDRSGSGIRSILSAARPLLLMAGIACAPEPTVPDADLAIVSATVLPMDRERTLPDHTVVVKDRRIAAVLPAAEVALGPGTTIVAGEGRFLIPGLAEMHGHLPGANSPPALTEDVLMLYVANGVTTVRGMQGHASQLALRDRIDAGELIGPRLIVGSPSMSGRIETPEEAVRLVREYHEAGFRSPEGSRGPFAGDLRRAGRGSAEPRDSVRRACGGRGGALRGARRRPRHGRPPRQLRGGADSRGSAGGTWRRSAGSPDSRRWWISSGCPRSSRRSRRVGPEWYPPSSSGSRGFSRPGRRPS